MIARALESQLRVKNAGLARLHTACRDFSTAYATALAALPDDLKQQIAAATPASTTLGIADRSMAAHLAEQLAVHGRGDWHPGESRRALDAGLAFVKTLTPVSRLAISTVQTESNDTGHSETLFVGDRSMLNIRVRLLPVGLSKSWSPSTRHHVRVYRNCVAPSHCD